MIVFHYGHGFKEDHAYLECQLRGKVGRLSALSSLIQGKPMYRSKKSFNCKSIVILQESYKLKQSLCSQPFLYRLRLTRRAISESVPNLH